MKKTCLLLTLMLGAISSHAAVYKWTDENGKIHYSDKPLSGQRTEIVDLPKPTTYSPPPSYRRSIGSSSQPAPKQSEIYSQFQIAAPTNEATIHGAGDVSIQLSVNPPLQADHRIQILHNGAPLGDASQSLSASIENASRGAHNLEAKIVDLAGNTIKTTNSVKFFVQRPSIKN